jgi:hypothetical protein
MSGEPTDELGRDSEKGTGEEGIRDSDGERAIATFTDVVSYPELSEFVSAPNAGKKLQSEPVNNCTGQIRPHHRSAVVISGNTVPNCADTPDFMINNGGAAESISLNHGKSAGTARP